jgi:hypothetical protein
MRKEEERDTNPENTAEKLSELSMLRLTNLLLIALCWVGSVHAGKYTYLVLLQYVLMCLCHFRPILLTHAFLTLHKLTYR